MIREAKQGQYELPEQLEIRRGRTLEKAHAKQNAGSARLPGALVKEVAFTL
jgi:hypothetical protein